MQQVGRQRTDFAITLSETQNVVQHANWYTINEIRLCFNFPALALGQDQFRKRQGRLFLEAHYG